MNPDASTALAASIAEPLGGAGAAFYFHPSTLAKGKELGLDGMRFYLLGRGGVLGNVHSDVIASAFGYFHPDMVAKLWDSASEVLAPRDAGAIYMACCAEVGRATLGEVVGLEAFCEAATAVIDNVNRAGLALFAGIAAEPLVDDLPGRALQLVAILRELRGSIHLNALLASGIAPEVAHAAKRPEMVAAFGWEAVPDVGSLAATQRDQAEQLTNELTGACLADLNDDQASALEAGALAIAAAVSAG